WRHGNQSSSSRRRSCGAGRRGEPGSLIQETAADNVDALLTSRRRGGTVGGRAVLGAAPAVRRPLRPRASTGKEKFYTAGCRVHVATGGKERPEISVSMYEQYALAPAAAKPATAPPTALKGRAAIEMAFRPVLEPFDRQPVSWFRLVPFAIPVFPIGTQTQ